MSKNNLPLAVMSHSSFIKYSTLTASLVSLLSLGGLGIASPSRAALIELGDLSSWDTFGDVLAVPETASMSNNALQNDDFGIGPDSAFNVSGNPAELVGVVSGLEEFLGLSIGSLDPDPGNFEFAFEGSAIKKTFTVQVGDVLAFDYKFLSNEPSSPISPLPDYAFLSIDGLNNTGENSKCKQINGDVLCKLAEVNDATKPSSLYTNKTGIESFNFTFDVPGTFAIGIGVVDVDDFDVSSGLVVNPIPEPTSTLSLLALGTLGAASTLKRKQK